MSYWCFALLSSDLYLPQAQVLIDSLQEHHPGVPIHLLYFGDKNFTREGVTVVPAETLQEQDCYAYYPEADRIAANRPAWLLHLLETYQTVILLGSDTVVYAPLQDLMETHLSGYTMYLTPHVTTPIPEDGRCPSMTNVLLAGQFNSDVMAFSNHDQVRYFLFWLHNHLKLHCVREPGILSDQSWFNLAPSLVPNVGIVRSKAYHAAYWNKHEALYTKKNDGLYRVNGELLRLYHFSGFNFDDPGAISEYQDRYRAEGPLLELCEDYAKRVARYS